MSFPFHFHRFNQTGFGMFYSPATKRTVKVERRMIVENFSPKGTLRQVLVAFEVADF